MSTLATHVVDVVERAVKTWVETFLVVWGLSNYAVSKVALWGAAAAALSAVWNISAKVQANVSAQSVNQP